MNAKATKGIFWSSIGLILFLAVATFIGGDLNIAAAQARTNVRLVLQITIDGLRADLINRYEKGFGKDGFRLLLSKGAVYTNAHYQHASTETIAALLGITPPGSSQGSPLEEL